MSFSLVKNNEYIYIYIVLHEDSLENKDNDNRA